MNIHSTLTSLTVPVEKLRLRARNPRRGDVAAMLEAVLDRPEVASAGVVWVETEAVGRRVFGFEVRDHPGAI